ncbi:MAG: DUF805 domain-containing protein [Sulfurovaceae bacterium]
MTFIKSIATSVFDKYATFEGRASRREYLWFILFLIIFTMVASVIGTIANAERGALFFVIKVILVIFALPTWAVTARRLHDINLSGWLALIVIPLRNLTLGIVTIILGLVKGNIEANNYGELPK